MSGYTSDFNEEQRQRERERQDAHRININLWPEQMNANIAGPSPGCEFCHVVLTPSPKTPGKLWCKDCGNEYGEQSPKPKPKRFKPKQAGAPSLIIASQPNRRKKRSSLGSVSDIDAETRADLIATGVIADTASDVIDY